MDDGILASIKKSLGLAPEYTAFDADIVMHINSVLSILTQVGIGPDNGFAIQGYDEQWSDFIGDSLKLQMVKSYVSMKVRLMFDPPTTGTLTDAINKQISELEWRMNFNSEISKEDTANG
jgi:hypothetical protein